MNNLKKRRLELGLSQIQISSFLRMTDEHYDVGMVSRLENEVCLPTPKVLDALCEVLQASKNELYGSAEIRALNLTADIQARTAAFPEVVQKVVNAIPMGRDHAVTRVYVKFMSGVSSDRYLREIVEYARKHGVLICNRQRGDGYYIADRKDLEDVKRQYWQGKHRAQSVVNTIEPFKKILIEAGEDV